MIKLLEYIILGFLQGVTEPIPVSSSGHLLILKTILERFHSSLNVDYTTLATITNFGSLIAIIMIYWSDIVILIKSFFTYIFDKKKRKGEKNNFDYCIKIILATIPAGVFGLVATKFNLLDKLEENVKFIGFTLLITALFLFIIRNFKGKKEKYEITMKDAIIIGLYQMVSVIPGISRSGAPIVGGMFQNLKRSVAFNFSFIMYIPISIATSILGIKDLISLSITSSTAILYVIAALVSLVFTYIFTKWFKKMVTDGKLIYFSIYCLVAGLLVIILL